MDVLQDYKTELVRCLGKPLTSIQSRGLEPLARALVGRPETGRLSCAKCQAILPEYVEAEIGDYLDPGDDERAAIGQHLLVCPECGWRHAELLQITWLVSRNELPHPSHRPAPRLPLGGHFA